MRLRFLLIISVFVLIILVIIYKYHPAKFNAPVREALTNTQEVKKTTTAVAHIVNSSPSIVSAPTVSGIYNSNNTIGPEVAIEAHNVSVNFWGKVVDQDDAPLSGVRVVMHIREAAYSPGIGLQTLYPKKETQTDSAGLFQWIGEKGDVLSVEKLEKDGYDLEPSAARNFGYNTAQRFVSSPNMPVVFKMWRTNIHEQLIAADRKFQIVPDGRPYFVNLTDGSISETDSGDLKIWVLEKSLINGMYDWSCEIDAVNGGLLEETDTHSSMFYAPVDGYAPSFGVQQQFKGDPRGEIGDRRFYLQLRDRKEYGKMTINLYAPFNNQIPGMIRLSYVINPSGSRILR